MNLKPYPKYKDSGVEWIGEIPDSWKLRRLRSISESIRNGTSETQLEDGETDYQVTRIETISKGEINYRKVGYVNYFPGLDRYQLEEGDILISHINSLEMVGNCAIYNGEKSLYSGMNLLRIRPSSSILPKWLLYNLKSSAINEKIKSISKPAINQVSVPVNSMKDLNILFPSFNEQIKIVSFLDKKTSEIDKTIEKDTRLIELLQEKRTALINHVVTKGLDPEAPMKDSGIEWIGEIPEGWKVHRMRYLLKNGIDGIKIGPFGSMIKSDELVNEGYKVYGQENVINTDFSLGSRYLTETKFKELINYQIFPKDLVITMMGTTGRAQIVPEGIKDGIMDSHLIRLRFNQKIIPEFAEILINSSNYIFGEIMYFGKGAIMHGLNSGIIKNLILAVPSVHEQAEILDYLEKETSKTDETINKIQINISLLQEYKKSLIHHVVTGKVDVRDVV